MFALFLYLNHQDTFFFFFLKNSVDHDQLAFENPADWDPYCFHYVGNYKQIEWKNKQVIAIERFKIRVQMSLWRPPFLI